MPRYNTEKAQSRNTGKDLVTPLDEALAKPDDEQLFYTASLHFLNKKLQEKTHLPIGAFGRTRLTSQSCYQLTRIQTDAIPATSKICCTSVNDDSPRVRGPSLSMHQLLPFPKSNKDTFFARLKKRFRKYCRSFDISETNNAHDADNPKHISNFKFPRCARRTKDLRPSCLVEISEETSNENVKTSNGKDYVSEGDVL